MLGTLRRRILTPPMSETQMDVRGFHVKTPESKERLESVGHWFLTGYGHAAEARRGTDAESDLESVPAGYRGFAYEGAAMAMALRDGLPVGGGHHVQQFLTGRAERHIYMVYVGVGWAMARLPRMRWGALYAPDPMLRWLVLDGYGFHQAYFHTAKYVHDRHRETDFRWPADAPPGYASTVIDQGVGRAAWFVAGTSPLAVARLIGAFEEDRHADLWSGTGLAAAYAGGADRDELLRLQELAGPYRPQLAQGAAFAAAARVRAGLVMPHNELATDVLCGMTPQAAAKVTDEALVRLHDDPRRPAFAVWRERISDAFVSLGPC